MRWLLGAICAMALAVAVVGCSETTCPECCGEGGSRGGGESVTDCGGVQDGTACTADGLDGLCVGDFCYARDCSAYEDGTRCASYSSGVGVCETLEGGSECVAGVFDCTGIPDQTRCINKRGDVDSGFGLCFDELCFVESQYCPLVEPGDLCYFELLDALSPGFCGEGEDRCVEECQVLEDGTPCRGFLLNATDGVCEAGQCVVE